MKSIKLIIFFLAISPVILAQPCLQDRCPYNGITLTDSRIIKQADDFTITTTDGITRNLYSTLDSGKTVFIDLFFTTCSWCQTYAPVIEEIYQNSGSGEGEIVFWGISNNLFDPDEVIDQYRLNYNITNPCAGPDGGGTTAHTTVISGQNFQGWPTYCVVCPDRTMYFDPCYPPTVTGFDPYFEDCGAFTGVKEEMPGKSNAGISSIYPNPANDILTLEIVLNHKDPVIIGLYNLLGEMISTYSFDIDQFRETIIIPLDNLSSGTYFLKMIQNSELIDSRKVLVSGR